MANKRKRELADGAPESPQIPAMAANLPVTDTVPELVPGSETLDPLNHGSPAGYEQQREQRIKENLQRMQKLGIADLSLKLKTSVAAKRAPRNFSSERKTPIRVLANEPRRRSSRLQNVEPVSYVENVKLTKQEEKLIKYSILLEEGVKPEFYTEEHEKQLGSTELEWTFFVDGYGADGNRIYDPVNGKTCHQCRQKTLGHRTHCSKCQIVQGQFCGDCLYMRYCGLCKPLHALKIGFADTGNTFWKQRKILIGFALLVVGSAIVVCAENQKDGLQPAPCTRRHDVCTTVCFKLCMLLFSINWFLFRSLQIASLGYKSVAHYLIQTMRAPPETEPEETVNNTPHTAKRSLAFTDTEALADDKETHKKLDYKETENGDLENEKSDHDEDCKENDVSILNVGNSCGPEIMEAKIEDEKEDKTTPVSATKTLRSCEPKIDSIARRTRSRNPSVLCIANHARKWLELNLVTTFLGLLLPDAVVLAGDCNLEIGGNEAGGDVKSGPHLDNDIGTNPGNIEVGVSHQYADVTRLSHSVSLPHRHQTRNLLPQSPIKEMIIELQLNSIQISL
ncbi:hypothetical protein V2J09_001979 [Rumex salicifolius]